MSAPNYFIDTNVFLRIATKDNPEQARQCEEFFVFVKRHALTIATSDIVIAEIVWTLQSFYKYTKPETTRFVAALIKIPGLVLRNTSNISASLDLYIKNNVTYIDTVIASNSFFTNKNGIIISFDREFDKLGIKRLEPKQVYAGLRHVTRHDR